MIDVLFALQASGDGELAEPIADYLGKHAKEYFTWEGLLPGQGYDAVIVGGAAAKVLVAAEAAGRDPRKFGGYDMVAETEAAIMRSGPDRGRVSDYAKNPELAGAVSNDSNVFGQALGVLGLAGVARNDRLAIDRLVSQQCTEGYFRVNFGYIPTSETGDHVTPNGYKLSSCNEGKPFAQSAPDGDTTGIGLSALLAARSAGAAGLDGAIGRAVAWLAANQDPGGGWGGGVGTEAPNTNSSGLIVQALADAGGADAQVRKGTAYLKAAQVTTADSGNRLAGQTGAIAYTPQSYVDARRTGITAADPWIRASAQAALGLSQIGFRDLVHGKHLLPPPPDEPPAAGAGAPAGTSGAGRYPGTKTPPRESPVTAAVAADAGSPPSPGTPAGRLGAYLARSLVGGDHVEITQDSRTYVDYDATADLVLALRTLGQQPEAVGRATRFLLEPGSIEAYAHGAPYETGPANYAEPLAKLAVVAAFAGADGSRLRADLAQLRKDDGRFADTGAFADNDGSVRRHAWATIATIMTDRRAAEPVVNRLLASQCADGTFPEELTAGKCETGDLAATALAVTALGSAPANHRGDGMSGARARSLDRAVAALDGALGPGGVIRTGGKENGPVDVALSATVAGGRQAAGRDASAAAQTLGGLLLADGGVSKPGGESSDFPASLAAAPGVAGRSWLGAADAPVVPAPRASTAGELPVRAAVPEVAGWPGWLVPGLAGLGCLLAAVFGFGIRHFVRRNTDKKGAPA
ncbi:hypothetical protein [Amycolatopsis sp. MtRt-6]|uniref:hypothetical protein n=1 Tax=Amycolatopsis sp. MtRt-6 TaxID=2792782 RepID=UPI001A900C87|nr:hypothetical protein [Amycolatopsis sp. MtRt-6]